MTKKAIVFKEGGARKPVRYETCVGCPYRGRTKVWGEGDWTSPCAFVGQSPGSVEAQTGRCFMGPAGVRLNKVFGDLEVARQAVWLTNAVKCFVPAGEEVSEKATECCRPILQGEIGYRKLIVAIGAVSAESCRKAMEAGSFRIRIFPIIHPAAALRKAMWEAKLRRDTSELKEVLRDAKLMGRLGGPAQEV
jgi:DNA polymerase